MTTIIVHKNKIYTDTRRTTSFYENGFLINSRYQEVRKIKVTDRYIFTGAGNSDLIEKLSNPICLSILLWLRLFIIFSFNPFRNTTVLIVKYKFREDFIGCDIIKLFNIGKFYLYFLKRSIKSTSTVMCGSGSQHIQFSDIDEKGPENCIVAASALDSFTNTNVEIFNVDTWQFEKEYVKNYISKAA